MSSMTYFIFQISFKKENAIKENTQFKIFFLIKTSENEGSLFFFALWCLLEQRIRHWGVHSCHTAHKHLSVWRIRCEALRASVMVSGEQLPVCEDEERHVWTHQCFHWVPKRGTHAGSDVINNESSFFFFRRSIYGCLGAFGEIMWPSPDKHWCYHFGELWSVLE